MRLFFRILLVSIVALSCTKSGTSYVNNPDAPDYLHNRPVGASAKELLAANSFQSLKIEILYMTGYAPDASAISHLQATLESLLNKPSGITIITTEITPSSNSSLSINDIIEIEKNKRTAFTSGGQIAVCIVYTNGSYTDATTLGVTYKNTSVAVFGKKIQENSGAIGQPSRTKLEATIYEHELGHLLGLVDLGSPMQSAHKDGQHGNHCNNSNCLMYYTAETTSILGFLITGNIPSFDPNCRADLQANGGK